MLFWIDPSSPMLLWVELVFPMMLDSSSYLAKYCSTDDHMTVCDEIDIVLI